MADETNYNDPTGLEKIDYDQEQVSPEVKKHTKNVRHKMYGRHVRESIARAIEVIALTAQSALNIAKKAFSKSEDTENRLDNQIKGLTSDSEIIDLRYSKMLKKDFNILKDRGDFWDGEHEIRGINLRWYGIKGHNIKDDTESLLKAYKRAEEIDVPILVPNGVFYIDTKEELDESVFFGYGKIFNNGKEIKISSKLNKTSTKVFQNNESVVKNTYGTFNNAVAHSVVVNGENQAEILGIEGSNEDYWLNLLAEYTYRDSAAQYLKNQSNLMFYDYQSPTFSKLHVDLNEKIDENIVEGMIIDTFHDPKCSAIIKKVDYENNRLYVHSWVRTSTKELRITPENGKGIRVNPMTAAFGLNIVVENNPKHPKTALAGIEVDVNKQQEDSPTVGIDMISMGKYKANVAFHARSNRGVNGWENGFISEGSDKAFIAKGGTDAFIADKIRGTGFHANGVDKAFISNGLNYKNELLSNEIGGNKFSILGDGTMNILRLGQKTINANQTIDSSSSINLLNGSPVSVAPPPGNEGKILFLANMLASSIRVNGKFVSGNVIKEYINLKPASAIGLISNGTYWIVLNFGGTSLD